GRSAFRIRRQACRRGWGRGRRRPWLRVRTSRRCRGSRRRCPNRDRKSTRLNSSHVKISYAVFCLKKIMQAEEEAIAAAKPGVTFDDLHNITVRVINTALIDLGFIEGLLDVAIAAERHNPFYMHRA